MLVDMLKRVLLIAIVISTISCSFIQKTKGILKNNKFLVVYSFVINMVMSVLFCISFTDFSIEYGLWVGLFSFIGSDTIYKTLEEKLNSYRELKSSDNKINE